MEIDVGAGSSSRWYRPEVHRGRRRDALARQPDPHTGLIRGATFLDRAEAFLAQSRRTAREVCLMSILVVDVQQSHGRDVGQQYDAVVAAVAGGLLDVRTGRDVVGRIGAAEFNWMSVLSRGSDLAWIERELRTAIDIRLEGLSTRYRLGSTLSNGRPLTLDKLMAEAHARRDARVRRP